MDSFFTQLRCLSYSRALGLHLGRHLTFYHVLPALDLEGPLLNTPFFGLTILLMIIRLTLLFIIDPSSRCVILI